MMTERDDAPEIIDILPPRPEKPPRAPRDWGRYRPRLDSFQWFTLHGAVALFVIGSLTGVGMTRAALAPSPSPGPSESAAGVTATPASPTLRPGEATPFAPLPTLSDGRRRFTVAEDSLFQDAWPAWLQAFMERLPVRVTTATVQDITDRGFGHYWHLEVAADGPGLGEFLTELATEAAAGSPDASPVIDAEGARRIAGPGFTFQVVASLRAPAADQPAVVRLTLTGDVLDGAVDATGALRGVEPSVPADQECTLVEVPTGFAGEVAATIAARGAIDVQVVRDCGSDVPRATLVVGRIQGDGTDLMAGVIDRFVANGVAARMAIDSDSMFIGCGIDHWASRPGMIGHWNDGLGAITWCYVQPDPIRPGWQRFVLTLQPADLDAAGRLIPDAVP